VSLRLKVALALAALAFIATTTIGAISYRGTSERLVSEVDHSIKQALSRVLIDGRYGVPNRGVLGVYSVRLITDDGRVVESSFEHELPVDTREWSAIGRNGYYRTDTVTVDGERQRVHTLGLVDGAVQVSRPLDEVDRVLEDLRQRTILLVVLVSLSAAVVGWGVASTMVAPLRRLTRAAEQVAVSGDLDVDLPGGARRGTASSSDEVARLSGAFAGMIDALARSRDDQQRLAEDAGHELRTPLTSLRTNLSVLRRHPDMSTEMKEQLFDDLDGEVAELTDLVNELVAVAAGEQSDDPPEDVELLAAVREAAQRIGRRRDRAIVVDGVDGRRVHVSPSALDRAVGNLLDNACKFDDGQAAVEVVVGAGEVLVRDRGPGVPEQHPERLFDRFHREPSSRGLPGSGLGLAIVREFVERSGGTVIVRNRDGGGAEIGFTLPLVDGEAAGDGGAVAAGEPLPPPTGPPAS
jgi:two-component system sensor histidine kinase MprB